MKSTTTRNASLVVTARCESIAKIAYAVFSCALGVEREMASSSSFMSAARTLQRTLRSSATAYASSKDIATGFLRQDRIQDHHPAFYVIVRSGRATSMGTRIPHVRFEQCRHCGSPVSVPSHQRTRRAITVQAEARGITCVARTGKCSATRDLLRREIAHAGWNSAAIASVPVERLTSASLIGGGL